MSRWSFPLFALLLLGLNAMVHGEPAAPLSSLAKMPVKEITVFKDGHAYVVHQGMMPTDASGNVLMDYLPTPILGTFWPYSADKNATLHSVTTARRRVKVERTAMTLRDLIEANLGVDAVITEDKTSYPATPIGFLSRSTEEQEATMPPGSAEVLPVKGNILLLKTVDGTRAVPVERITDVKFIGKYQTRISEEEYRNLLTMKLDWGGKAPEKTVEVGMAYVQKGVRWIPNYRIELDGNGKATVKLQATLLNEMTDLENATVHLVVGVPSFQFKGTTDPIALSQVIAQLSQYFQTDAASTQYALSNSMMTQVARSNEVRQVAPGAGEPNLGPDIDGGGKSEDLYVYTVKNVTLKKGQRMVLPVSEYKLDYKDIYTLDVPFAPPPELRQQHNDAQIAELLKLLHAPKVMHKLRLSNSGTQPLTTAPALVLKGNQVLAQSMMTYTARGGSVDLTLTTAVDVKVKKTDKETKRTPNAANLDNSFFFRIDIGSELQLTNYGTQAIEIEITRYVLGNVGEANQEGKAEMVNLLEEDDQMPASGRPPWWGYYSWPNWWGHFNGIGRISWKKKLEPGKSIDLAYSWHYFWR